MSSSASCYYTAINKQSEMKASMEFILFLLFFLLLFLLIAVFKHNKKKLNSYIQSQIFNNLPIVIWAKDVKGRYLAANRMFEDTSGLPVEKILGKDDFDVWPKHMAEHYISDDKDVIQLQKPKYIEEDFVTVKGTGKVETYKTPIFDKQGNIMGTVGVSIDITKRREYEFQLLQNQETISKAHKRETLLRNVIETIRSSLDIQEVKEVIVREIGATFHADRCYFRSFDKNKNQFMSPDVEYLASEDVGSLLEIKVNQEGLRFFEDQAERQKDYTPLIVNQELLDKKNLRDSALEEYFEQCGIKTDIAIPMWDREDELSFLVLHYKENIPYVPEEDLELMETLAKQVIIAIDQAKLFDLAAQTAKREALLRKITDTIRSSLNLNETVTIICDEMAKLFGVERAAVSQFTDPNDRSIFITPREYKKSPDIKGLKDIHYSKEAGRYIGETVLDKGINLVINNMAEADVPDYFKETYFDMGVKSALCVPIKKNEDKWGTIFLAEYIDYRDWSEEEILLLQTIADQIYIAINQAKLFEAVKQTANQERVLREIIEKIRSTLDINEIKSLITTSICQVLDADRCFIIEYDKEKDVFELVTHEYLSSADINSLVGLDVNESSPELTKVIKGGKEILAFDTKKFLEEHNLQDTLSAKAIEEHKSKTVVALPITYLNEVYGGFAIHSIKEPRTYTDEQLNLIRILATQTGIAIYQSKLYEKERQTAERETSLRQFAEIVRSTLDKENFISIATTEIGKTFKADRCIIVVFDKRTERIDVTNRQYLSSLNVRKMEVLDEYQDVVKNFAEIITEKGELYIADTNQYIEQNNLINSTIEKFNKYFNIKSDYSVQVWDTEEEKAYLVLQYTQMPKTLTADEIALHKAFANQIAISFQQTSLYEKEKQAAERERILRKIIETIRSVLDISILKNSFVKEIGQYFNASRVIISEYDKDNDIFLPVDKFSEYLGLELKSSMIGLPIEQPGFEHFLNKYRKKETVIIPDGDKYLIDNNLLNTETQKTLKDINFQAGIGTTIVYGEEILGILTIHFAKKTAIQVEDIEFFKAITNQLGVAIYQVKLYEKEKQTTKRERLLRNITEIIRSTLDIQEIKLYLVNQISSYFNADRCFIHEYDIENNITLPIATECLSSPEIKSILGENILEIARELVLSIISGKNNIIRDAEKFIKENRESKPVFTQFLIDYGIKSGYGLGIFYKDIYFGTLVTHFVKEKRILTEDELDFLQLLVDQAGIALYQANLYEKERKTVERETLLRNVIESIRESLDINNVFSTVCNEVLKVYKVQRVSIVEFPDKNNYKYWIVQQEVKARKEIKGLSNIEYAVKTGEYNGEIIVYQGQNLIIDNLEESDTPDFYKETYRLMGVKSILSVPIRRGEDTWGLIFLCEYNEYRHWTEEEITLLNNISDQIYLTINQARLYEKQKQTAAEQIAFINNIPDMGWYKDKESRYIWVNKVYAQATGLKAEEHVGKTDFDFFPKEQAEGFKRDDLEVMQTAKPKIIEEAVQTVNGKRIMETYKTPVFDDKGNVIGTIGTARDITEKKEAEQELISRQEKIIDASKREKVLREITETIRSTLDKQKLKNALVTAIGEFFKADRILFSEFDEEKNIYQPVDQDSEYLSSSNEQSFIGYDWSALENKEYIEPIINKQELNIYDWNEFKQTNTKTQDFIDLFENADVRSSYNIPVLYSEELMGYFCIEFTQRTYRLSDDELNFIRDICRQAAIGLYQARLYATVKQTADKESLLREIISEIKISQTIEEAYNYILTKLSEVFDVDRCNFFETPTYKYEKPSLKYEFLASSDLISLKNIELSDICYEMFQEISETLELLAVNDVFTLRPENEIAQRFFTKYQIKSSILIPLVRYNHDIKILGILALSSSKQKDWSEYEIDLLKSIIDSVVTVIWEIGKIIEINNLRDTFIETLAHDLQVPMVGERRALEFILTRPSEQPIGSFKEIIIGLISNNEDLRKLLKKILSSYYYEANRKALSIKEYNLLDIIQDSVEKYENLAKSKSISIMLQVQENLPKISVDHDEILDVINTILDNAVSNTQEGGEIIITGKRHNNIITTCIKDNGSGIPPEVEKNLFRRYEVAKTIERKVGSGLGLYLAKQIIEAHGGKIWYKTEVGKGTSFCFSLLLDNHS